MKAKTFITKNSFGSYIMILVGGLLLGWILFHDPATDVIDEHGHSEHVDDTIWTCSMHPEIRMEEPGLCPICGMDLTPLVIGVNVDSVTDPNEIEMSDAAVKLAQLTTTVVNKGFAYKEVYLSGKVESDERNISELTARYGGRVEKMYVNFTGQTVKKGDKLATIYSPDMVAAQKELIESLRYRESNPELYIISRNKLKTLDITDQQINEIESSGEPQYYLDIFSPNSGIVTLRNVTTGGYIAEGDLLFRITDIRKVWVMLEAYESDLPWLNVGNNAEFTLQALPGEPFTAQVAFIDPFIDTKTRVAKVRLEVENKDQRLKPGMFVNGIIKPTFPQNEKGLLIPRSSVLWTGKRSVVYVKVPGRKNSTFLYREVTLGPELSDHYIVSDGLAEGEEIVLHGLFKIDAAAQLEGKKSMMNPEGNDLPDDNIHSNMNMENK